ncbi:hypothetical protein [Actinomadura sp. DC4]|uniref:hypothetical protein n=1 Tax=Actinomadura sp. DC4 TaxID=3055069 RepID=UPI0025AFAF1D|nr:hypothetical protein [Actinomadura sp. DC4]MDN3352337.1 hypothetical protein [Actinomadura sp. DC4]
MSLPDSTEKSGRVLTRPVVLAILLLLFVMAGCGTLLLTGQGHQAEARAACERFVRGRLGVSDVHFSHERVRDVSSVRHVVTGTALTDGRAAVSYTCTVSHAGTGWALNGLSGV